MPVIEAPPVTASIPWGCWYGDGALELQFPAGFSVELNDIETRRGLSAAEIVDAVRTPVESPPLRTLADGADTAVIAVDDISRPTPMRDVLPALLRELSAIPEGRITVLIALGAHRPMVRSELESKLGPDILGRLNVEQHHPYENLVDLGRSKRGTPVRLNRTFHDAAVKVTVGCVLPHPYMGYGGGAKMVVPGLAGIDTLQANHQPAVTGITGGLCDPESEARRDIEDIALAVGLRFSCNAVVNARREIAALFCGHVVASHRVAATACRAMYTTVAKSAPYDVVCLNAYPKDTELLQAGNTLNCYRSAKRPLVREGGTIVVTAACSTGRGYHSLHGKDMRLYRTPVAKPFLEGREVIVFSPNLNRRDFEVSFWKDYRFANSWADVVSILSARHGASASVGVFPLAPLQILD
jgi:nickel-dependent lactate racemase